MRLLRSRKKQSSKKRSKVEDVAAPDSGERRYSTLPSPQAGQAAPLVVDKGSKLDKELHDALREFVDAYDALAAAAAPDKAEKELDDAVREFADAQEALAAADKAGLYAGSLYGDGGAPDAAAPAPAASSPAVAATTSPAPPSEAKEEGTRVFKIRTTDPQKTQKAIDLAEYYIGKAHPGDAMSSVLGLGRQPTKPVYKVVQGTIGRESQPHIDMKIVSVASCLPGEDVNASDTAAMARLAFNAIEHYARLPKVTAFFLLPYNVRAGTMTEGAVPPEEACRVYSGVENLLLEIYDELPSGGVITDAIVEQKIDELIKSVA